ncbi:Aldo-keto reductase like protein, partial [Aduncisulcus paluster]
KPEKVYPRAADGTVLKYNDLPEKYRGNVDVSDPPFERHLGDKPAMTAQDEADIIAFLRTLTDGYRQEPSSSCAHNGRMNVVEGNGAKIPAIGLGTWELRGRTCARIVEQALRLGYRHIDTAQIYDNEREVGEGLRASGIKRNDVFVTTKVWTTHFLAKDLERSAKESLARLRLTETLGALARVRQAGLARHIGLSNFSTAQIEEAVAACPEPLACDQVEYHPYHGQA